MTDSVQPFNHDQLLVIGVCGHWWQSAEKYTAFVQDCPHTIDHASEEDQTEEDQTRPIVCGRPPSHGFEPRIVDAPVDVPGSWALRALVWWPPNREIWTTFHPITDCRRLAERGRRQREAELAFVFAQMIEADANQDYRRRYGLVLEAVSLAHALGYPAGFAWDDSNPDNAELAGRRIVAYIELPTRDDRARNQVSWHMPEFPNLWDGHTTSEKWDHIRAYVRGDHER